MSSKRPGEFELIAQLFAPLARNAPGAFGLADDAAVIKPPKGEGLVVTADALVEGVHFFRADPADTIARKSLRVNLSDLAAKGAVPTGYLLALALPDWSDTGWLRQFADGLARDQEEYGVALLGGDTTSTAGPLTIAITALGSIPEGAMVRREGAKPGDLVFVTGTIGDAGGGLALLKENVSQKENDLVHRYRLPEPRVKFGQQLRGLANAAIDVSDGLIADLGHIADVSGVHIAVDAGSVPLSPALRALWGEQAAARAAVSGDDYEIAFTAPPSGRSAIMAAARACSTQVTEIGRAERGEGVVLRDSNGREIALAKKGFVHF